MERVLAESVRLGNEITEMAATLTAFIDELEARRGGADAQK